MGEKKRSRSRWVECRPALESIVAVARFGMPEMGPYLLQRGVFNQKKKKREKRAHKQKRRADDCCLDDAEAKNPRKTRCKEVARGWPVTGPSRPPRRPDSPFPRLAPPV